MDSKHYLGLVHENLKQQYNQKRQLKVTNEIIEIISGAQALND